MFISSFIAFRILNIALLLGVIAYLLKKKYLKVIHQQIDAKHAEYDTLIHERERLEQQHNDVMQAIKHEHTVIERLKHNLVIWQTVQQERTKQHQAEVDAISTRLRHNITKQHQEHARHILKQQVLTPALNEAQAALEEHFRSTEAQQNFIKDVFKHLPMQKDIA